MIEPMTRPSRLPSGFFTTSVYRQSWLVHDLLHAGIAGQDPTPQMAQSWARPAFISRSRYMA